MRHDVHDIRTNLCRIGAWSCSLRESLLRRATIGAIRNCHPSPRALAKKPVQWATGLRRELGLTLRTRRREPEQVGSSCLGGQVYPGRSTYRDKWCLAAPVLGRSLGAPLSYFGAIFSDTPDLPKSSASGSRTRSTRAAARRLPRLPPRNNGTANPGAPG